MRLAEWYEKIREQFNNDGIKVVFKQPSPSSILPLVHVGPHTDLDVSTKTATLNEVDQQINIWCESTMAPADFEDYVQKVKWSLSKVGRWDSLTTQTMFDDSSGRDLRRALLMITITI